MRKRVTEKSRHFFDFSTMKTRRTDLWFRMRDGRVVCGEYFAGNRVMCYRRAIIDNFVVVVVVCKFESVIVCISVICCVIMILNRYKSITTKQEFVRFVDTLQNPKRNK